MRNKVSVPSFGDSFFISTMLSDIFSVNSFPSPHSGILFLSAAGQPLEDLNQEFPSPYSGILFYRDAGHESYPERQPVSVPSFGDSFFIKELNRYGDMITKVSVPSFGDSFFMRNYPFHPILKRSEFPSPHSGILFL